MNKFTFNRCVFHHGMHKVILIMKLIIIIMTTCLLQVSASSLAQKVTLSEKNTSLEQVFTKIRMQTGYGFVYTNEVLKGALPVTVQLKNASLNDALQLIFKNQPMLFSIENNTVVIKEKEASVYDVVKEKVTSYFNDMFLQGKILDDKGQPLPGATVKVKRTGKGTITNANGEYRLQVEPTDILVISYVGYISKEVKVADSKRDVPFVITLALNPTNLNEVKVSTGYYELPKERATGSFEVISATQLEHSTNPNLLKRLEGITTSMNFNNQLTSTFSNRGGGGGVNA